MTYSLAVIVVFFFIYQINVYLALNIDTFLINLFPRKKLPIEFVDYKNLSEVKKIGNHDITLFHKGERHGFTFQILSISNDRIILKVITKTEHFDHGGGHRGENYTNTLFKMDSFGKVLDTITFKTSSSNQSEFGEIVLLNKQIVNKDLHYHQTWPTDGNKAKKEFIPLNKDLTWSPEKIEKYYYDTVLPNSTYIETFLAWRDKSLPVDKRASIIYFANNKWYTLYGISKDISDDARQQIRDNHKKMNNENEFSIMPNDKMIVKHFQKTKYNSIMIGRTQSNGVYTNYYWNGIAYVNIIFENDTLKLKKEDVSLDDCDTNEKTWKKSKYNRIKNEQGMKNSVIEEYSYYSNPNLKFTLICEKKSNNLYIVKKMRQNIRHS